MIVELSSAGFQATTGVGMWQRLDREGEHSHRPAMLESTIKLLN